jgi:G3E family GTPase
LRYNQIKVNKVITFYSEINIDASLIKNGESALRKVEEKIVELQNGCICCTLREDLLVEIVQLAKEKRFDYLLIESSGISEPMQVAETFTFADEEGNSLAKLARLDTCATVVDCLNFFKDYCSSDSLEDRGQAATKTGLVSSLIMLTFKDERKITTLLVEQIEFANVILLNKTDLVSKEELAKVIYMVKKLNPDADIVETNYSKVPLEKVLNTKKFDLTKAEQLPGWLKEIRGQHVPETQEYGISSTVFRSRKPFHPQRLHHLLFESDKLKSLLRSKGYCWIATRMNSIGIWSHR